MKISDAANLLELTGNLNPKLIKQAYKKACLKYHPDKNPAGNEMMKAINLAFEVLKDFEGKIESSNMNYGQDLNNALSQIVHLDDLIIEVCGAWVWVTGETKKHAKALGKNGAGFFYASKKKAWYFRPDDWKSSSRGSVPLDEIRDKYGASRVKKQSSKRLAG